MKGLARVEETLAELVPPAAPSATIDGAWVSRDEYGSPGSSLRGRSRGRRTRRATTPPPSAALDPDPASFLEEAQTVSVMDDGPRTGPAVRGHPRRPAYLAYHDEEWGVPVHDDHTCSRC